MVCVRVCIGGVCGGYVCDVCGEYMCLWCVCGGCVWWWCLCGRCWCGGWVCVSSHSTCKLSGVGAPMQTGPGAPTPAWASNETLKGREASPFPSSLSGTRQGALPPPDGCYLLQSSPSGCGCVVGAWRSCLAAEWATSSGSGIPTTSLRATPSPISGRSQNQEP